MENVRPGLPRRASPKAPDGIAARGVAPIDRQSVLEYVTGRQGATDRCGDTGSRVAAIGNLRGHRASEYGQDHRDAPPFTALALNGAGAPATAVACSPAGFGMAELGQTASQSLWTRNFRNTELYRRRSSSLGLRQAIIRGVPGTGWSTLRGHSCQEIAADTSRPSATIASGRNRFQSAPARSSGLYGYRSGDRTSPMTARPD